MSNFEFISYLSTPQEKHLGIATVKMYNKIILRYKIVLGKDGVTFFPASASYKISDQSGDRYISAFTLDSLSEKEEVEGLIRSNVKRQLESNKPPKLTQPLIPISSRTNQDECPF